MKRSKDTFQPPLDLERDEFREKARQGEIAALKPKVFLCYRFVHIAELAVPWAGVMACAGSETPAGADFVGHFS